VKTNKIIGARTLQRDHQGQALCGDRAEHPRTARHDRGRAAGDVRPRRWLRRRARPRPPRGDRPATQVRRHRRERLADTFRRDLGRASDTLTDARERELLAELRREFEEFIRLDRIAYRALRRGDAATTKRIFLGPELAQFAAMADTAELLAHYERRRATASERAFDDARDDARKRLIAVALGAGLVIVLLLVTAWDVARMALEGERHVRARSDD
jgi:hypothetical protein